MEIKSVGEHPEVLYSDKNELTHREVRSELAKELPKVKLDVIEKHIVEYQASIDKCIAAMGRGEKVDFEALSQHVHILMMLHMGKNRANERQLEEIAQAQIRILRDQIQGTYNTKLVFWLSIISSGAQIASGIGSGVCYYQVGVFKAKEIAKFAEMWEARAKLFGSIGQIGSGIGPLITIASEKNSGQRDWLQHHLQKLQSQEQQNRSDIQSHQQKEDQFLQQLLKAQEAAYNTKIAIARAA